MGGFCASQVWFATLKVNGCSVQSLVVTGPSNSKKRTRCDQEGLKKEGSHFVALSTHLFIAIHVVI